MQKATKKTTETPESDKAAASTHGTDKAAAPPDEGSSKAEADPVMAADAPATTSEVEQPAPQSAAAEKPGTATDAASKAVQPESPEEELGRKATEELGRKAKASAPAPPAPVAKPPATLPSTLKLGAQPKGATPAIHPPRASRFSSGPGVPVVVKPPSEEEREETRSKILLTPTPGGIGIMSPTAMVAFVKAGPPSLLRLSVPADLFAYTEKLGYGEGKGFNQVSSEGKGSNQVSSIDNRCHDKAGKAKDKDKGKGKDKDKGKTKSYSKDSRGQANDSGSTWSWNTSSWESSSRDSGYNTNRYGIDKSYLLDPSVLPEQDDWPDFPMPSDVPDLMQSSTPLVQNTSSFLASSSNASSWGGGAQTWWQTDSVASAEWPSGTLDVQGGTMNEDASVAEAAPVPPWRAPMPPWQTPVAKVTTPQPPWATQQAPWAIEQPGLTTDLSFQGAASSPPWGGAMPVPGTVAVTPTWDSW